MTDPHPFPRSLSLIEQPTLLTGVAALRLDVPIPSGSQGVYFVGQNHGVDIAQRIELVLVGEAERLENDYPEMVPGRSKATRQWTTSAEPPCAAEWHFETESSKFLFDDPLIERLEVSLRDWEGCAALDPIDTRK